MLSSKLFDKLDALQGKLQSSTNFFQFVYYRKISKQLSDPSTNPKCYWNVLKTLLNGTKIPCIPPLFQDNKFITDFKEKSKTFNSFFAKQCSLIANGRTLPSLFPLIKEKSPANIDFSVDDIKNIINKLDSNKVHGDDMISILMLKLCDKSICKPLNIIFKSSLIFPKSSLISKNQSEFKPGDSCVTNYQTLLMKSFPALMTITKLEGYSLIFQKLSIKCGTTELFINLNATGSQETY